MQWIVCTVLCLALAGCATRSDLRARGSRGARRAHVPPAGAEPAPPSVPVAPPAEPPPPGAAAAPAGPERRLAEADARMALVKGMRGWPSEEDRDRWRRDVAAADEARARVDATADPAAYADAVTRYEDAVSIAFASYQTIEMGARSREGR